jgi:peroxiredoxin
MKWPARALLLLVAAATPIYLWLDGRRLVPVWLRDRPLPFILALCALAWLAQRRSPGLLRVAVLTLALGSSAALGWTIHSRYRLPPSSMATGAPLADLTLANQSGQPVRLRDLRGRPLLLIWFRGSWCPYCRKQLADVAAELAPFGPDDLQLLAVAPDPPAPLQTLQQQLKLPFPLLADPDRHLMNACELGHCVAILDAGGVIRWAVVSGNWQNDLPARALLQAAYRQK